MKDFEPHKVHSATEEPEAKEVQVEHPHTHSVRVVVFALVAGIVGGMYGSLDLAQRPFFQNLFGNNSQSGTLEQRIVVDEESATTEVVKSAGPAVVSIVVSKDINELRQFYFDPFGFGGVPNSSEPDIQQVGAGTGFFISRDGMIVTNKHVVEDDTASYTVVTNDGKSYEAKILAKDPVNDIAIIKVEISDAPALEFADSSNLELGQHVIAIGNSLGQYQNTVTSGVISGIGRSFVASGGGEVEQLEGVIQTDAAINSGNSGGPLLNLSGYVVGINTAVDRQGQSIGFAIPANDVKVAVDTYRQDGKITRPYLGIRYMMINESIARSENLGRDYGALVISGRTQTDFAVLPGSPAARAGIVENDIILEFGGQRLDENNTLSKQLKNHRVGDIVDAKVFRDGEERIIKITIGETR